MYVDALQESGSDIEIDLWESEEPSCWDEDITVGQAPPIATGIQQPTCSIMLPFTGVPDCYRLVSWCQSLVHGENMVLQEILVQFSSNGLCGMSSDATTLQVCIR